MSSLEKMSIQVLCPFLNWIIWGFFGVELYNLSVSLDSNLLPNISLQLSSPTYRLPFCFVDGFLLCAEAFYFAVIPTVYFCFVSPA